MKEVSIIFANLQSHELTKFSLKPGINFILADDNNVGKSTIFKVLTAIAKAPEIAGVKIDRLIRVGVDKGYAAFSFEGERVVAWFSRGATAGAAKIFFEYVHADGETTRHLSCPLELLNALGIVIDGNRNVINFNDADSVQLISRNTSESDAIITHVMQDQRVETVKSNILKFYHELEMDDKSISARLDTAEHMLKDLSYVDGVDEFNDSVEELEALCRICDGCLKPLQTRSLDVTSVDFELIPFFLNLCKGIQGFTECKHSPVTVKDIERFRRELDLVRVLGKAKTAIDSLQTATSKLNRNLRELDTLRQELSKVSKDVVCPIKGRVYYTDEQCLPHNT